MTDTIPITRKPIFVVGAPRSGTTVLAVALSKHSHFWTSGESYVPWELVGCERGEKSIGMILQTAEVLGRGSWLTAQAVDRGELLNHIGFGINALYTSRAHGRRWIDHTPVQSLMISTLGAMFPDAVFLHALRDGREVVNSMIHFLEALEPEVRENFDTAGWQIPWLDFTEACRTWRDYTTAILDFTAAFPARCHTVHHSEIVSVPEALFRGIAEYLGAPDEVAPARFVRTERLHPSFKPDRGQQTKTDPWSTWSEEQRRIFEREAGPLMVRCGFGGPA